jgi:hypothetical protein
VDTGSREENASNKELERIAVTADSVSGRSARRCGLFRAEDIAVTGTEFPALHKAVDSAGPSTRPPSGLFQRWNPKDAPTGIKTSQDCCPNTTPADNISWIRQNA